MSRRKVQQQSRYDAGMNKLQDEMLLAQRLVQASSPSGSESPATGIMVEAFEALGFDEAYLDPAGNAVGVLRRGDGPTVMLNGHLDTVPVGDEALWPHPPLSGEVADGMLWGRGTVDMKASVACMAYAARDVAEAGFRGTLLVTGVVQEEVGGLGARYLAEHAKADVVILGEPSSLRLMLGHRGRVELELRFKGQIAHAAKNELGVNALYPAADFLKAVQALELPKGGPLLGSSLTPTCLKSFPLDGANVVPGEAQLTIDYRNIPGDEPEAIVARLQALAPEAEISIPNEQGRSESGEVSYDFPRVAPPYLAPRESQVAHTARETLRRVLAEEERDFTEGCWWFCTDAPYLSQMGAVIIGFGPGDETLAHTTQECVPLAHLATARRAYAALARAYLANA